MALSQAQDGVAIQAQNIGKRYRIYAHPRDRLKDALGYRPAYSDFWALKDVSFRLRRGQVAGLVGRNGSGKTTLLQILAGVTQPTTGRVSVCGRTAAILELGSGFDPEQTGRENALLYGQVMGMSRAEIFCKLPAIERFADIGEFFDRPVKLYSAGMQGRLAFAVCAFVDADLLLIDEALSVGDGAFQRKCFSKIREVRERGATILFATHDTNAVRLVCDVAMMLEGGQLRTAGDPAGVVDEYLSLLLNGSAPESANADAEVESVPAGDTSLAAAFSPDFLSRVPAKLRYAGDGRAEILGDRRMEVAASMILDGEGEPAASVGVGDLCTVRSLIRFRAPTVRFWFGVLIRDRVGQAIFGQQQSNASLGLEGPFQPGDLVAVDFRFCCELRQDTYFVSLGLGDQDPSAVFFYASDAMELPVEVKGAPLYGVTNLPYEFRAQAVSQDCVKCPAGGWGDSD